MLVLIFGINHHQDISFLKLCKELLCCHHLDLWDNALGAFDGLSVEGDGVGGCVNYRPIRFHPRDANNQVSMTQVHYFCIEWVDVACKLDVGVDDLGVAAKEGSVCLSHLEWALSIQELKFFRQAGRNHVGGGALIKKSDDFLATDGYCLRHELGVLGSLADSGVEAPL